MQISAFIKLKLRIVFAVADALNVPIPVDAEFWGIPPLEKTIPLRRSVLPPKPHGVRKTRKMQVQRSSRGGKGSLPWLSLC